MFVIVSGFIFLMSLVVYIVVRSGKFANHHIEDLEPDNPLLLTVKAMEAELAELHENNIHMKRIAQLEEQIKEARAHAEALSKVAGNYDSAMEEVGETIVGSVGGRDAVHTVTPNSKKPDNKATRQYIASYRTYTSQAGWSSYCDVKLK